MVTFQWLDCVCMCVHMIQVCSIQKVKGVTRNLWYCTHLIVWNISHLRGKGRDVSGGAQLVQTEWPLQPGLPLRTRHFLLGPATTYCLTITNLKGVHKEVIQSHQCQSILQRTRGREWEERGKKVGISDSRGVNTLHMCLCWVLFSKHLSLYTPLPSSPPSPPHYLNIKAKHECLNKVSCLLNRTRIFGDLWTLQ